MKSKKLFDNAEVITTKNGEAPVDSGNGESEEVIDNAPVQEEKEKMPEPVEGEQMVGSSEPPPEEVALDAPEPEPEPEPEHTIGDLAYKGPEPAGTNPIAPKLKGVNDILTASMSNAAREYYDRAMEDQFGPKPQTGDMMSQLKAILKPNPDTDMVRTLIHFNGTGPNYAILEVQPAYVKQAWELYKRYERPVPGRFMEIVFDILKTQNRRYIHKVVPFELR